VFVVAAAAALSLTGTKQLQNGAVGESARGDALMNAHQIGFPPEEYVYLHSSSLGTTSSVFQAAVRTVSTDLTAAVGGPVTVATSSDHHAALVSAPVTGPLQGGLLRSELARLRAGYPQLQAVAGSGSGGSGKSDLARAEQLSVPVTLFVLVIAFGALVAALVPLLLAVTAVVAAFGLLGPVSQTFPPGQQCQDRRVADWHGGRSGLRPVLCGPLPGGTPAWPVLARRARIHRPYFRAVSGDSRDDGGGGDGGPVRDRVDHLQRDR
jgi:RND superfamily putative drug exporter